MLNTVLKTLVLFFGLFSVLAFGQADSLTVVYDHTKNQLWEISQDDLNTYKENPAFNYEESTAGPNIFNKIINWAKNILLKILEFIFGVEKATGILQLILKALPYLLLGILLYTLIKLFINYSQKQPVGALKKTGSVTLSNEEHIIKNEDIEALISKAIHQNNYRLAIRYYYLLTLKYLTEKELIHWQQQKTNTDYLAELEPTSLKPGFAEATHIYDYVWYGEFNVEEAKFNTLKTIFEQLNNTIKSL
ncbi:hypothetical protein IA57_01910 [Mangrovimonas yunxiaonensis]|uniref:Protein-glutamine gamma-glutamyltransferase-like C-terminal domain-containing protein n=1 Tax=Mangrovimonas yunxiaonensis TaxID=1197477 RepID=A0A084TNX5_9FLAO|nr:DUF4129 domain-containing protein [Mangrovimonas yunxiaonensis]KFB02411.1 hypothetical protein IA57_01910 [Mangrovimonas yunxiaonensis]GGH40173.1 hypothetical protein GCM10011364_10100 [Mangrovimonas yunxiaonensis]